MAAGFQGFLVLGVRSETEPDRCRKALGMSDDQREGWAMRGRVDDSVSLCSREVIESCRFVAWSRRHDEQVLRSVYARDLEGAIMVVMSFEFGMRHWTVEGELGGK